MIPRVRFLEIGDGEFEVRIRRGDGTVAKQLLDGRGEMSVTYCARSRLAPWGRRAEPSRGLCGPLIQGEANNVNDKRVHRDVCCKDLHPADIKGVTSQHRHEESARHEGQHRDVQ